MRYTITSKSKYFQEGIVPFLLIVLIAAMALGVFGYLYYQKNKTRKGYLPNARMGGFLNKNQAPVATLKRRSKAPGIIKTAVVAKSLDKKTGSPKGITTTFSATDPNYTGVYISLELNKPKKGQKFAYVRYYFNSKKTKFQYIDHKSVGLARSNAKYTYFHFFTKSGSAKRRPGQYLVKVYSNGIFEKSLAYQLL